MYVSRSDCLYVEGCPKKKKSAVSSIVFILRRPLREKDQKEEANGGWMYIDLICAGIYVADIYQRPVLHILLFHVSCPLVTYFMIYLSFVISSFRHFSVR